MLAGGAFAVLGVAAPIAGGHRRGVDGCRHENTRCRARVGKALGDVWHPDMRAALGDTRTRIGDIAFDVRTERRFRSYGSTTSSGRRAC